MKKLLHYLCYLVLVFSLFISYSENNNLKAIENNDNFVFFDYADKRIIDTVNKNFIGENGYLEKIRKYIISYDDVPNNFQIFFTKNDIYVVQGNVDLSFSIYYNTNSKMSSMNLTKKVNLSKSNAFVYKLSAYDNFDAFLNNIGNYRNANSSCNYSSSCSIITVNSNHDIDFYYKNYDYLESSDYDYIVPYYSTSGTTLKTASSSGSLVYNIPSISDTIGFNVQVPYSYDLYGYDFKAPEKHWLFSIDLLVSKEDLERFISKVSFKTSNSTEFKSLQVLGRVTENGVYHWEDITYHTGKDTYLVPDYQETYENGTYNAIFVYDSSQNIDKYDMFYLKFYFNNVRDAYAFNFEEHYMLGTYFNDVDQTGIFDTITSLSMDKLHVFTTPLSNYNYHFFYLDYVDKTTNGLFPLHKFFKIPELTSDDIKNYETYSYNSYYGNFKKVTAGTFGNTLGLYTYLVNGTKNGIYNTINELYYYTPVDEKTKEPIIYISTGTLDSNRLTGNIGYIDKDGNIVNGILRDDFENYYKDSNILSDIASLIIRFFLPTKEELSTIVDKVNTSLSEKLGGVWQLIEIPITLFSNIISSDVGDSCLSIPDINEPFTGMTLFSNTSFCFNTLRDSLPTLFTISDLLISIIATLTLANAFRKKFSHLLGGGFNVG